MQASDTSALLASGALCEPAHWLALTIRWVSGNLFALPKLNTAQPWNPVISEMLKHVRGLSIPSNCKAALHHFEGLCYRTGTSGVSGTWEFIVCGQTILCKAWIREIIWRIREEGCGCCTAACCQEGVYAPSQQGQPQHQSYYLVFILATASLSWWQSSREARGLKCQK